MPADCCEEKIHEELGKFGTITSMFVCDDVRGRRVVPVNLEAAEAAQHDISEMRLKRVPIRGGHRAGPSCG